MSQYLARQLDDHSGGEFNGLNRSEANRRVRAENAYRDKIIEKYQQEEASPQRNVGALQQTIQKESDGAVIAVQLSNKTSHIYPMQPLIAFCGAITQMVTWRKRCGSTRVSEDDKSSEATSGHSGNFITSSHDIEGKSNFPFMELSLVEFDADATISFMELLISLHTHGSAFPKHMNTDTDELSKQHLLSLIDNGMISEIHIVECIKLAHYLQCSIVLDCLASILEHSVDTHNCMALCFLADAMNLKQLFEASVSFVIERLDTFQGIASKESGEETQSAYSSCLDDGDGNGGFNEVWTSLPHDLRSRVLTMRNVLRSSVIGRGSKLSGLFFSSAAEFLAIFRETIRDQEERLAEARKRCDELIRERRDEWAVMCLRRGTWFDRSVKAQKEFVFGTEVMYSLDNIERQSRRIQTLRLFYEDQKIIFRSGGFESEIIL